MKGAEAETSKNSTKWCCFQDQFHLNSAGLYVSYYGNEGGAALLFLEPMASWGAGSWSDLPVTLYLTSLFNLDFESCLSFRTLFFPVTRDSRGLAGSNTVVSWKLVLSRLCGQERFLLSPSDIRTCSQQPASSKQVYTFLRVCIPPFSHLIMQESVSYLYRILFFLKIWSHHADQAVL